MYCFFTYFAWNMQFRSLSSMGNISIVLDFDRARNCVDDWIARWKLAFCCCTQFTRFNFSVLSPHCQHVFKRLIKWCLIYTTLTKLIKCTTLCFCVAFAAVFQLISRLHLIPVVSAFPCIRANFYFGQRKTLDYWMGRWSEHFPLKFQSVALFFQLFVATLFRSFEKKGFRCT